MSRTRSSIAPITRARKCSDNGARCAVWTGGSIANSMLRIIAKLLRRHVLDDDAAFAGREDLGVAGDVCDVGVAQHRPEPGFTVHRLPVHRVGAPQHGERLVRRTVDERVGAGEVDGRGAAGHRQPTRTFGRGRPSASQSM